MRVLSGSNPNGVRITSVFDDPVTVDSTGSIGSAMDGTALYLARPFVNFGFYWDVTNYGRITAQGTRSVGVAFQDGGKLVNGASTDTDAYISGGFRGISLPNGGGAVVNYGTIAATSAHSVGIYLPVGGQVENFGLIRGQYTQIQIGASNGSVANYGTIGQTGAGTGIDLLKGGTVINGSSAVKTALIIGGIQIPGGAGTVTNAGSIAGFDAIFLDAGGTVTNTGNMIGAETGINIYGSATVVNHGTISGNGPADNGDAGGVIFNGTASVGFVSNLGGGYITGSRFGIYASSGTVTVANTAQIANGVVLQGDGNVTNGRHGSTVGRIVGGIYIRGNGTVVNYGTVSGENSGECVRLGAGLVENFGLVEGQDGVLAGGTVANYGTIRGISSSAGYAVGLDAGGLLTNSAGGYIGAAYGVGVFTGNPAAVANSGVIADGIFLQAGGSVVNGNSGSTGGLITEIESPVLSDLIGDQAIDVSGAAGTVTNYGTIAADNGTGIRLQGGGTVRNNQHSALISGADIGVGIGAAGAVVNRGTILASGDGGLGLSLKNSFNHTVINSGTITGAGGTAVVFGAGNDRLIVDNGGRFNGIVSGGGGTNEIDFNKTGTVGLAPEYVGFSTVRLGSGAPDALTVTAAAFTGLAANTITIDGGDSGNTITAALPAIDRLALNGGVGADSFSLSAQTLANTAVAGGLGADNVVVTTPGTVALGGLSGVESIALSSAGKDTLVLHDANFSGVNGGTITVTGGNAGNTMAASLPAADKLVLRGGSGADTFSLSATTLAAARISGGAGSDRLVLTGGGTVRADGVNGVETYLLANGAAETLTLGDGNFAAVTGNTILVLGGSAGNTVNAAAVSAAHRVVFVGGAGRDSLTGGAGADTFKMNPANLGASDRLRGGTGSDRLVLLSAGAIVASGVAGIETIALSSAAKNTLTLTGANFSGVAGRTITVDGGSAGDTITAAVPGVDKLVLHGGSGGDRFDLSATTLAGARVTGGLGTDRLVVTTAGALAAGGISGVETYVLANGGADSLILVTGNFAGVSGNAITVVGASAGNRISEASVAPADLVTMKGGAGVDTLIAGRHAIMTGNGGADLFELTTPGTSASPDRNRVTDFSRAQGDKLAFSDAGFHLGLPKAGTTPKVLPAGLFSPRANGTFDKPGERFAYDKATGRLYFDADGSGAKDQHQLVASLGTLSSHPTLSAAALFFVA